MRIYILTLLGVFIIVPSLLFLFSVNLYGQGKQGVIIRPETWPEVFTTTSEWSFEKNFESVNGESQINNKIIEIPFNSIDCSEVQPNQNLENNWFTVEHVKDRDGGGLDDPAGVGKFAIYRIFYQNPKNDKINKTLKRDLPDFVKIDWWEKTPEQIDNDLSCDPNNKSSNDGETLLGMIFKNEYEGSVEYRSGDCELEVKELQEESAWLDIYESCFTGANKEGAYMKRIEIEAPEGITYESREGANDKMIRITNAPEVAEDTKDEDIYTINFSAYFCTGEITDTPREGGNPIHDQCNEDPQGKSGTITVTVKNVVDGKCGTFQTRCVAGTEISASTASATWACFCRQNLGTFAAWYCEGKNGGNNSGTCEGCSAGSVFNGKCAPGGCRCAQSPPRGTSNSYQCRGYGGSTAICFWGDRQEGGALDDRPVVITFDKETNPAGMENNRGSRVQSITFRATDNYPRGETSWRMQKIYKNQPCGSDIYVWDRLENTYTEGSPVTLGAATDNGYTFCFASRKDDTNTDYEKAEYYVTIDTTYNRGIRFSVGGAPAAPSATISGTAEPGSTVAAVSVTSNEATIPLSEDLSIVTADSETGAWSITIPNAVDPDRETNLEVVVRTTDDFSNEIEQTHRTTVNEDGTVDSTTTTTDSGNGGNGNGDNGNGDDGGNAPPDPRLSSPANPPPFTIEADNARISEGESIKWTITRRQDATEEGFTVSCKERGAWGATPLSFSTQRDTTGSFTMKTTDDDTPESSGSITCSVSGRSPTASSSYSVSITSNDQVEESNLIVNCSFGEGNDCGIEHLFELANNIMKLLLWLAITGAGILIFYRGAVLAINVFVKGGDQEARKKVKDALRAILFGLIFILSAYLIVNAGFNIIGYNLGNPFQWNEAELPPVDDMEPAPGRTSGQSPADDNRGGNAGPQEGEQDAEIAVCEGHLRRRSRRKSGLNCSCNNCNDLPSGLLKEAESNKVVSGFAGKLQSSLKKNIEDFTWIVTEAWPPTRPHSNNCHYTGTCVDIAFRKNGSPVIYKNLTDTEKEAFKRKVKTFIEEAGNAGLRAVFETRNSDVVDHIKGIPGMESNALLGNYDDHFSVYSNN